MPSGSKRRKAAKKKKGNQSTNHPDPSSAASAHSHGGDDVKHQEDKEIDVGDISSPESQEEVETGANISTVEGVKVEVVDEANKVVEVSNIVLVERDFKNEDESDKKDGAFEHDEPARKSYDGGSSGSSSSSSSGSSSDDESHGIKTSHDVLDIDPVKVTDSSSGGPEEAIHSTATEEAHDLVEESIAAVVVSGNVQSLVEEAEVSTSSPADNSVPASIVESIYKEENGEQKLSSLDAEVGISEGCKDIASHHEEAVITSVETITAVSDPKQCVAQETNDRLTVSYNVPIATADHGADVEKDYGVTEPLLAPAPHPVQTTSWKSCCGLFEMFSGR